MKKRPIVSIYITSHNYDKFLDAAIKSVFGQSFYDWELFLINDGSEDKTEPIMLSFLKDRRVRYLRTENIGLSRVANMVLKKSRGKYLIRLDADDVFDPHILLVLSNYLDINPKVAIVFPDYFLTDQYNEIISLETRKPILENKNLQDIPAHGACTMIRISVLKKVGGYREDLGAQDGLDIWTKISKKFPCGNVNLPLFYYRRHGNNLTNQHEKIIKARRIIKKDAVRKELKKRRPIISVIPCRELYDVEKNLWQRKIDDGSLLDLMIKTSLESKIFDQVVVISDTPAVKSIMKKYKDERLQYMYRNKRLTSPAIGIKETLKLVAKKFDPDFRGISVISYIQAPFTTTKNLEEAVSTLLLNGADSAIAVEEISAPLFKRSREGLVPLKNNPKINSDFDTIYVDSRTSMAILNSNLESKELIGKRAVHFSVPHVETFFITSKRDLVLAEHIKNHDGK